MPSQQIFRAHVNPLQFLELDEPWATAMGSQLSPEAALRFSCGLNASPDLQSIASRYREISTEPRRFSFVPVDQRLDDKLTGPLRAAKSAYMLGNPLASMALSGMVAEMLAMLMWEMASVSIGGQPMLPKTEEQLLGRKFERLGQERRIAVLRAYGLISDVTEGAFTLIRTTRNKYLHLWTQDHDQLARDAVLVFHAAVEIAITIIGQDFNDGRIRLTESMLAYLSREGRLEDVAPEPESAG